jgi:hypothetical protein
MKLTKKLQLQKETLHALSGDQVNDVAAAGISFRCSYKICFTEEAATICLEGDCTSFFGCTA